MTAASSVAGYFDFQSELADVARVDDRQQASPSLPSTWRADQKPRHFVDWTLRRREADVAAVAGARLEPRERQREMRAALVPRYGVDLIHDDRRTLRRPRLLAEVSRRYRDSGVVTRICGGVRSIAACGRAGVSPVRTAAMIAR